MAKKTEPAPAPAVIDVPVTETAPPVEALVVPGTTEIGEFADYGDDAGRGYENQTSKDTTVPWIQLLQSNSPVVGDDTRDPPLRAGQWFNTALDAAYPREQGFLIVPAYTEHVYAEWTPRNEGGGYHGRHAIDSAIVAAALKEMKRYGKLKINAIEYDKDENPVEKVHQLVETYYVYGIICLEDGTPEGPGAIALKSTAIRPYKGWQTKIQRLRDAAGRRPPLYAHLTRFTAYKDKNDSGEFFVPKIEPAVGGDVRASLIASKDPRYQLAKEYKRLIEAGQVKHEYGKESSQQGEGGPASEDLPF